ncbi:MAG: hypothetical protein LBO67_00920 [Spirochaetaceae bacterium]|jgi:hypothetical protein|nr:hypothetical protein [Spirochaetaceae bacterium]
MMAKDNRRFINGGIVDYQNRRSSADAFAAGGDRGMWKSIAQSLRTDV